jgi:hypothetical protein
MKSLAHGTGKGSANTRRVWSDLGAGMIDFHRGRRQWSTGGIATNRMVNGSADDTTSVYSAEAR